MRQCNKSLSFSPLSSPFHPPVYPPLLSFA